MNLKLAIRSLRKSPFITAAAVISLALGIGANAAIFSILHQVLLEALPVAEPSGLVNLSSPGPKQGESWSGQMGDNSYVFSYPMFKDLERQQSVFSGIAAHLNFRGNLSYGGHTEAVDSIGVSGSYFPLLGLRPALGRLFVPADDDVVGEPHAVVLSYDYWQKRFGGDPGILNQTIVLNGQPVAVVGVAPIGFKGTTVGHERQIFAPMTMMHEMLSDFHSFRDRKLYLIYLFARLKPGVGMAEAAATITAQYQNILKEVDASLQTMSETTLARFKAKPIKLEPGSRGQSDLPNDAAVPLVFLAGITMFVLLIACSNIANLLLARATSRAGEIAVRLSLGATRRQLVIQLLSESCLLAVLGGLAGIVVAKWTLGLIASFIPQNDTLLHYELNTPVLLYMAALTLGTGVLFGLFPALQTTKPDLQSTLKGQSGQHGASSVTGRLRTILTTAQIALSMALLILAGLFVQSLRNVAHEDLGLTTDHVITFRVSPGLNGYSNQRTLDLFQRIEDSVGALPGVSGVTDSAWAIFAGNNVGNTIKVQGFQNDPDTNSNAGYTMIGTDYFRTLGIPLIAGREFTAADSLKSPKVVIVNEQFIKKFNLGKDALGKRIGPKNTEPDTEIVGVVRDAKFSDVKEPARPMFFLPYRQNEELTGITFYIRTSLGTNPLLRAIPPLIERLDGNVPVQDLWTFPEQVDQDITGDRMVSMLSALFAAIATLLAAVGLYATLAYVIAQRTKEIGIRIALGAAPATIHTMVFKYVGSMTLIGGIIGLAAALGAGRFAQSLLFQLNGHDPVVLSIAGALLLAIAFVAGYIPAYRAARIDPIKALRYD
jgi:predicted permease